MAGKRRKKGSFALTLIAVLVILILAFAVFAVSTLRMNTTSGSFAGTGVFSVLSAGKQDCTVWYITPDGTVQGPTAATGSTVTLDTPAEITGYTFLGWKDEAGNMETRSEVTLWEDTYYAAVYAVALGDDSHPAYLTPDENGFLYPNHIVTRGEAAEILYSLFAVKVQAKNEFLDLTAKDECCAAAAALRALGIISGSRFYPDDTLTLRDALEWLSGFYPAQYGDCTFADLGSDDPDYALFCNAALNGWIDTGADVDAAPNTELTLGHFVQLLNRAMGRSCEAVSDRSLTGTLLDVPFDSAYYADLAEASVPHEYTVSDSGEEVWTASETPAVHESGYLTIDHWLYYVQEDGTLLTGGEFGSSTFDDSGRWTSGNAELDEIIHETLEEYYDETATPDEYLITLYNHITHDFKYTKGDLYDTGEELPIADLALSFLSSGSGNCYSFASAFCELARALGYDAQAYSGTIISGTEKSTPHSWVEVTVDGETFICDPEMEWQSLRNNGYTNMYMMTLAASARWEYNREASAS